MHQSVCCAVWMFLVVSGEDDINDDNDVDATVSPSLTNKD